MSCGELFTTETQRTQRLHREETEDRLQGTGVVEFSFSVTCHLSPVISLEALVEHPGQQLSFAEYVEPNIMADAGVLVVSDVTVYRF